MPVYDFKRKVYVTPIKGMAMNYGFLTNVAASVSQALGHTDIGAALPPATVFGANAPKPARATKRFETGLQSSFIDADAVADAKAQGWSVGKAKIRRGGTSAFAIVVYVPIQGIKYAWAMPLRLYNIIGSDLAGLGINVATPTEVDLVFGASSPKPPRAYKVTISGGNQDVISTFVDPTVSLPAGWKAPGEDYDPTQSV